MAKWIKNIDNVDNTYSGQLIVAGGWYEIGQAEAIQFSNDSLLISDIALDKAQIGKDGTDATLISDYSDQINYLKDDVAKLVSLDSVDPDTGGLPSSPKWAPDGWSQTMYEVELETSKLGSIHERGIDDVEIGHCSLNFYELVGGVETLMASPSQNDLDTKCVRTDLSFMPDYDYAIKGGQVAQTVIPTSDFYLWAVGADLDAAYGGPQKVFLEGGLNLAFTQSHTLIGLDGVAATVLDYSHPQLGPGAGTNRLRFICRHDVGFKHRIQMVLDLFRG